MKLRLRLPPIWRLVDWWLYLLPILLVGTGLAVIISLTYSTPRVSLAMSQGIFALVGILLMAVVSRIDYRNWRGFAPIFYSIVILLLVAVPFFGVTIFGARRWLAIGSVQIQPAELAKLALIFILARFLSERETLGAREYFALAGLIGLPVLLVMRQPDLGTAIILIVVAFALCVAGGVSRRVLAGIVVAGLLFLPVGWHFLAGYQRERVITFLHPESDPYGAGYNVLQALIAVGSGGLMGQGLGRGSQSQLQFLPVAHTDFIFSGVAEATGLFGSVLLLALFLFLLVRMIRVAQLAKDQFGMLVAVGFAVLLLTQMTINVGMNLGVMPVTGVPLPFVSHGGSALLVNFIAIGILQSILLRHKKITF